jgi:hypothetical protein
MVSNNTGLNPKLIASSIRGEVSIIEQQLWSQILEQANHYEK